jgi:hypothetical protein
MTSAAVVNGFFYCSARGEKTPRNLRDLVVPFSHETGKYFVVIEEEMCSKSRHPFPSFVLTFLHLKNIFLISGWPVTDL